jgi:hypothetical protein
MTQRAEISKKPDPEKIEKASACLKALAHPLRLQVLCVLREGEKTYNNWSSF